MIEFENVSKTYPSGAVAVADVNLTIPAHHTTVLVGSSGCGKTTLLRMINRMVDPSTGRVLIDGQDVADTDPVALRRSIGYVLQSGGLLPHHTVLDNVTTVLRLQGARRGGVEKRGKELLDTVGLDPAMGSRYPAQLSGGQRQRVGVARALAADPAILLMDEPFAAVDPIVRAELQAEVARLQGELHKTIVFVTHDIDEALLLGERVIILSKGANVEQEGAPEELLANPATPFVANFLGVTDGRRRFHPQRLSDPQAPTLLIDGQGRTRGVLEERP
ncbi:ABC transporter ATP-binding protein [Corynebacterium uberis]|uniref:ABC transporter ATP-binding protein n=1 Tax=Corynebacterium TaxID=1716 RepID=UPI001D0B8487|nr:MULTISPECIES: ATP-binding cassette domain-containing protein [Corynebacterium]MCZ9310254.1 ATP-binding cassette domain-containing protein [Corynebacterium sp. c6VSa_13]UDL73726.1 ATP-binding cassette domain-containing protein [Corynebacterium uberis]UDL75391.1 ATP-binding cassette domain-containing protein [Corynebacterium uberis]UDL77603.1 ATP-binding cassette domain-containing protein [Corynebacterium uberis]UDL79889.1 ATP-binding cassette domain-containing protein [Corynebacterium uberis